VPPNVSLVPFVKFILINGKASIFINGFSREFGNNLNFVLQFREFKAPG
jgi:hypothetical protein